MGVSVFELALVEALPQGAAGACERLCRGMDLACRAEHLAPTNPHPDLAIASMSAVIAMLVLHLIMMFWLKKILSPEIGPSGSRSWANLHVAGPETRAKEAENRLTPSLAAPLSEGGPLGRIGS